LNSLRVLLIEDDAPLAATIAEALRNVGWTVQSSARGADLAPGLKTGEFDVAILDINLPDIDGFTALKLVRQAELTTPILVLTARDAVEDRVMGLEGGADDYVLKPFALSELIARLAVLARRHPGPRYRVLKHGPLRLDRESRAVSVRDEPLEVSRREWMLLELLLVSEGRVVSKEDIVRRLSADGSMSDNAVEVYVFRLRSKVESFGIRLRTVRGFGYMLEPWRGRDA